MSQSSTSGSSVLAAEDSAEIPSGGKFSCIRDHDAESDGGRRKENRTVDLSIDTSHLLDVSNEEDLSKFSAEGTRGEASSRKTTITTASSAAINWSRMTVMMTILRARET